MPRRIVSTVDQTVNPDLSLLQAFRHLFHHLPRRRRIQALAVVVMMLVGATAELFTIGAVVPFLTILASAGSISRGSWVGGMLETFGVDPSISVIQLTTLFCIAVAFAVCIRLLLLYSSQKFVFRVGYDLSVALYRSILYQSYEFHISQNSSEILSSINKIHTLVTSMLKPVMQGISALVISIFIMAGLLLISYQIAFTSIAVFAGIYLAVSLSVQRKLRTNSVIISKGHASRTQAVQEGLGGIRDVLLDGSQPIYIQKFAHIDSRLRDALATNAFISAVPRYVIESVGMVLIALLAFYLSRQEGGLMASLPALGALALGAQRLMPSLQLVYAGWAQATGNKALLVTVINLLDRPSPIKQVKKGQVTPPIPFAQRIVFEDVAFRYAPGGSDVISGLDLEIRRGSKIGFIGKTGSGKSTVVDLLMGLLHPSAGSIRVDGQVLTLANVGGWQSQIAHVPQHIFLADTSFSENIAFGVAPKDIDLARVRRAAAEADIGDLIDAQPEGYQSKIGERGVKLSGGQRQRIGIARALYKQSAVLILDEATSALDDLTEATITAAFNRMGSEITVVMIAHRLTTLRSCDVIYRMEAGRIVQQGNYDDVVLALIEPPSALSGTAVHDEPLRGPEK